MFVTTSPDAHAYAHVYGERGRITESGGKLQCHLCGRWFRHLGLHAWKTHELTADQYRREMGLHPLLGLVTEDLHLRMSVQSHFRIAQPASLQEEACLICGGPLQHRQTKLGRVPKVHSGQCRNRLTALQQTGKTIPEAARLKIRAAALDRGMDHLHTAEARAKSSASRRGKPMPEATKRKLSERRKGCRGTRPRRYEERTCRACGDRFMFQVGKPRQTCGEYCQLELRSQIMASLRDSGAASRGGQKRADSARNGNGTFGVLS